MYCKLQQHKRAAAVVLFLVSAHIIDSAHAFAPVRHGSLNTRVAPAVNDRPLSNKLRSCLWENSSGVEASFVEDSKLPRSNTQSEIAEAEVVSGGAGSAKKSTQPTPSLVLAARNMVAQLKNVKETHAAIVAMSALAVVLAMTPLPSEAASSGGRMGGSYSSPSRSSGYSRMGPTRSSSGGYGRGLGTGFAAGYGAGAFSQPSFISPFYSPFSVFPRPYYGGYGAISYNPFPVLPLILFAGVALAINSATSISEGSVGFGGSLLDQTSALGSGTSVVQLTIALEVSNRDDRNSILSILNRLAFTAKTDSRVGIQNLTSQVALELLRRKSSIVSASSNYKHFSDRTKALREYNNRSIQERGKFESETVSNYGGVDYSGRGPGSSKGDSQATMAVVTLLLSIDGDSTKIPQINSIADVETALRKIASDSKVEDCLQSAEILWTPEERYETLSPRDVISDYPELRSI